MRLHEFILGHREQILREWEAFARTCGPAGDSMDVEALRDHANEMLTIIATDLKSEQDPQEQYDKSTGNAAPTEVTATTAAEEHGAGRAKSGFTVEQMVAEYRALRATVIRLWTKEQGELAAEDIEDLTRFNEAIDQSLAESVAEFNDNVEKAKEMFLAILGHDLRTPLGAIYTSAKFMLDSDDLDEPHRSLISRIATSATRTMGMVGDLLDFTRSRLGGGIPIIRVTVSLGKVLHDVVDEMLAAHPGQKILVDAREEPLGNWDAARLSQAFANLIGNAVEHGASEEPVTVQLRSKTRNEATITIHNRGALIPSDQLDGIFNPMKSNVRPSTPTSSRPTANLGLGLYIAERIIHAHGGWISVESTESKGTTFQVHLPLCQ